MTTVLLDDFQISLIWLSCIIAISMFLISLREALRWRYRYYDNLDKFVESEHQLRMAKHQLADYDHNKDMADMFDMASRFNHNRLMGIPVTIDFDRSISTSSKKLLNSKVVLDKALRYASFMFDRWDLENKMENLRKEKLDLGWRIGGIDHKKHDKMLE